MRYLKLFTTALLISLSAGPVYSEGAYDLTPTGVKSVYAGYDAYLPFVIYYPSGRVTKSFFFDAIEGLPDGVTAEIFGTELAQNPLRWPWPPDALMSGVAIHVSATAGTVAGDYVLYLSTHDQDGNSNRAAFPLRVLPAPDFTPNPPSYQPPIPSLAAWEEKMVTSGTGLCEEAAKNQSIGFGYEGHVWYYDGARVFYQMHEYTGQDVWLGCAKNIADQYAKYVNGACNNSGCGLVPGWRVFPKGVRKLYERFGDENYRLAVENLANSPFTRRPGSLDDRYIRETAYAAEALIEAKFIDSPKFPTVYLPKLRMVVSELIGMYEVLFDSHTYGIHQAFYDGLAAEALIDYYTYVEQDPRIPPTIKNMLDWIWNAGWDQKRNLLVYDADSIPWIGHNGLLGLIVPAFAWYYSQTGDLTYLQRGDELFGHVLDEPFWSGKQFSQTFRWTFDYVKWRSGTSPVGVTVPEHVYPSGKNRLTVTLREGAGGKCGESIGFPDAGVFGLPNAVPIEPGQKTRTTLMDIRATGQVSQETVRASYRSPCGTAGAIGMAKTSVTSDHLDVVLTAPRVPGGMFHNNRVTVDGAVPADGLTIALESDRPDLVRFFNLDGSEITSISVPGSSAVSDYFFVDSGYVAEPTTVQVTATAGELTGTSAFVIDPPAARIALQNGSAIFAGFRTSRNQVVIDAPAPAGGTQVTVWPRTAIPLLPQAFTVTVPEGQISTFFTIPVSNVTGGVGEGTLCMTYGSGKFALLSIGLAPRTLSISNMPKTIRSGQTVEARVAFNSYIPAEMPVKLTVNSAEVNVPDEVVIPRSPTAQTVAAAPFWIQAGPGTEPRVVTITARTATGLTATATVTVNP